MECQFTEKISLLLDEELASEEVASLREHLKTCGVCKRAEKVFLEVRHEIKAEDPSSWPFNRQDALRKILNSQNVSLWRRRVLVPVPVMVALLITIFALSMWLTSLRLKYATVGSARVKPSTIEAQQPEQGGFDLSRFDHGERAAVIKIKREEASSIKQ